MQNDSTDNLNRVRLFAQHSESSLTADSKCIAKHIVKRLTVFYPAAQNVSLSRQLLVVHSLILFLKVKYLLLDRLYLFKFFLGVVAENLVH